VGFKIRILLDSAVFTSSMADARSSDVEEKITRFIFGNTLGDDFGESTSLWAGFKCAAMSDVWVPNVTYISLVHANTVKNLDKTVCVVRMPTGESR
jgi:hypothetical protein